MPRIQINVFEHIILISSADYTNKMRVYLYEYNIRAVVLSLHSLDNMSHLTCLCLGQNMKPDRLSMISPPLS